MRRRSRTHYGGEIAKIGLTGRANAALRGGIEAAAWASGRRRDATRLEKTVAREGPVGAAVDLPPRAGLVRGRRTGPRDPTRRGGPNAVLRGADAHCAEHGRSAAEAASPGEPAGWRDLAGRRAANWGRSAGKAEASRGGASGGSRPEAGPGHFPDPLGKRTSRWRIKPRI